MFRFSSMEFGRPYFYIVDIKRVQVGCAKGCPFKLWATYTEGNQTWQVKTLVDKHKCI